MDLLITNFSRSSAAGYKDGDIVVAASQNKSLWENAQNIFNKLNTGPNPITGYYDNPFVSAYLEQVSRYKYTRLNSNEVKRIDLENDEEEILSATPNHQGRYVLIDKSVAESKHLFGSAGKEVWYDGRQNFDTDKLWGAIETHSDFRKAENLSWPFTPTERRYFLIISCAHLKHDEHVECSSKTAVQKTRPIYEEALINPITNQTKRVMARRRRWFVPYWDYSAIDTDITRNQTKASDFRNFPFNNCETHDVDEDCRCKIKEGLYIPEGA